MKKLGTSGTLLLSAACALAVGAAVVLGNGWLASRAFAANTSSDSPAAISAEIAAGASAQTAEAEPPVEIGRETTRPGEDGTAMIMKKLDNGTTVFVRYSYGEGGTKADVTYDTGDGRQETFSYEGDAAAAAIERFGGPKRDTPVRYTEGQPGENDIARDAAVSAAMDALTGQYALRQETLDRFSVTTAFYSVYEDLPAPVWYVSLYPANADEFSEIGCYTALIDAETGETVRLLSAADGKG